MGLVVFAEKKGDGEVCIFHVFLERFEGNGGKGIGLLNSFEQLKISGSDSRNGDPSQIGPQAISNPLKICLLEDRVILADLRRSIIQEELHDSEPLHVTKTPINSPQVQYKGKRGE